MDLYYAQDYDLWDNLRCYMWKLCLINWHLLLECSELKCVLGAEEEGGWDGSREKERGREKREKKEEEEEN